MAPVRPTRNMGMYSTVFQDIYDDKYLQHKKNNGPIAWRTRSRTAKTRANQSPDMTASGAIVKPRTNARVVKRASTKLARERAHLKRHLETSRLYRDSDGEIPNSIFDKIEQLTTTDRPAPYPATWADERQMRRRIHPRTYLTHLDEMERMWSEEELEEEFGILPGEEAERNETLDGDWEVEREVEDMLVLEGRCLSDLEDRRNACGVWRQLKTTSNEREWCKEAIQEHFQAYWKVMDRSCVEIVEGVRRGFHNGRKSVF